MIKYALSGKQNCTVDFWRGECDIIPCGLSCKSLYELDVACIVRLGPRFFRDVIDQSCGSIFGTKLLIFLLNPIEVPFESKY